MKLPLAYSLKNRASSLNEDAKLLNGYVESRGDPKKDGLTTVEKRPALDVAFELTSGSGQALYVTNIPNVDGSQSDVLGTVIGDILTRAPGAKKKALRFGVQPTGVVLTTAISPSVTVTIRDSLGAVVNATDNVTLALASNPTGAILGGTLTRAAVAGTATFNDLTMNRSGEDFTLIATATSLNSATSNPFTIATQLAFTVQPSTTQPNTAFSVTVAAQDTAGTTDTNYSGFITMAIYSASPGGATLGGNLLRQAVNGVATFPDLTVDIDTTATLVATAAADSGIDAYTPALRVSNSFVVSSSLYSLVAGEDTPSFFTYIGFNASVPGIPVIGSITPTTVSGQTIIAAFTFFELDPPDTNYSTQVAVSGTQIQSLFASITNNTNGKVLLSSAATFTPGAVRSTWQWDGVAGNQASNENMFTAATTYSVTIV